MENIAKLNHFGEDVSNSELVKKSQLGDKSAFEELVKSCLLYTSPSPRDVEESRMPSSA